MFWVNIFSRFITICTQNPLRAEVQLLLLFFLFWCWRVIVSLPISSHGIFQFNSEDALPRKWPSHWNTGLFFCWVEKPRFLGRIAYFNTLPDYWTRLLIDDGIQRVAEKTCGKNSSSCVCLCRFERALNPYTDKSGSFGKSTDVLISYTHQKQGVMAFSRVPQVFSLVNKREACVWCKMRQWQTSQTS